MAGWPSIEKADDQRLAQTLRAGEDFALAQVYDAYAPRLFDYCHALLSDEETAALGLHDSLITVQERIGELPDPRLFRGWLYAVTRRECMRRRAHSEAPAERQQAAEAADVETDEATRQLVHAALLVLTGHQREALDLSLRHELDPHELAEVLATTPQEASVRVGQARHDLDDAFAAVVVVATGRDDCPSVAALAGPQDQPLDAEICGRLARHIANCPICGPRGNRKVATARLLHTMPVAALPADLRSRVLTTASAPHLADVRATIAMRAEPPADEGEPVSDSRRGSRLWLALAALTCGILLIGGIFLILSGGGGHKTSGDRALGAAPGDSPSGDVSPSQSGTAPSPRSAGPTPAKKSKTPTPTPSHSTRRPAPQPPAPPPPRRTSGRLAVTGCHMEGTYSCTVTVTAQGGPVSWSVTGTSGPISAGGSGHLSAGESAGVRVRREGLCIGSGSGSVSFSSGGSAYVTWNC